MSSFAAVLKQEITRLARKEVKANTESTRRATAQFRRDIAELKRIVKSLERRLSPLEKEDRRRLAKPVSTEAAEGARFSPRWVKSHREKLGLSQADYARLVGVSALTIYNWEHGRSRPRKELLGALVSVRKLGQRDAARRLELLD